MASNYALLSCFSQLSSHSRWIFPTTGLQYSLVLHHFTKSDALENIGSKCLYLHLLKLLSKRKLQQNCISALGVNKKFLLGLASMVAYREF